MRQHPLITFFAAACGISWTAAVLAAVEFGLAQPVRDAADLLAKFGPTLAALVVSALLAGFGGVKRLAGGFFIWRVNMRW